MSTSIKTYQLGKVKKLIDLNHDMINFKANFEIKTLSKPFQALIINQYTLDTVESSQLEYKQVDTSISGEVIADKNVYQNYYIILRSDEPTEVEVKLETTRLPDLIPIPEIENYTSFSQAYPTVPQQTTQQTTQQPIQQPIPTQPFPPQTNQQQPTPIPSTQSPATQKPMIDISPFKKHSQKIYFIIGIIIVLIILYYVYKKNKKSPIDVSNKKGSLLDMLKNKQIA